MPFNGSGVYALPSGNPVVTGTVISSTWANNTLSDIANNGLTNCLTKDGQQTPNANIPMGGFRITGLGDAVNLQDAPTTKQVQNASFTTLSGVSGTDTITAASAPSATAYVFGQVFRFLSAGANTTTSVTLNINSLGAKSVTKVGSISLGAGDIAANQMVSVIYDGTRFQLLSPQIQYARSSQFFVSGATAFIVPAGVTRLKGRVWGGGGGGAGMGNAAAGGGGGGGGGGYSEGYFAVTPGQSITCTVGAAGAAGNTTTFNGGAGGTSSIGAFLSATGGSGGTGFASGTGGGGGGGVGSGSSAINLTGNQGQNGIQVGTPWLGGQGGGTFCTSNTFNSSGTVGSAGIFPGGGGGGGTQNTGGGGAAVGLIILEW